MKYFIYSAAIAMACVFYGCSKSKNSTPAITSGSMSAVINGKTYTFNNCYIEQSTAGGLAVTGYDSSGGGYTMDLAVTTYTNGATGTYSLTTYPDLSVIATLDSNSVLYGGQTGNIVVKTYSSKAITGTFQFTSNNGYNVYTVTNGMFTAVRY